MQIMKLLQQSQTECFKKQPVFNTKGYFYKAQPYCEQYLKAKHEVYEKSRKLRQAKSRCEGKENSGVMFEFEKPKAGFYQLKGCKMNKPASTQRNQNEGNNSNRNKAEYLSYFLKKYTERKQKKQKKQQNQYSQILLPAVRLTSALRSQDTNSNHCISIGSEISPIWQNSRIMKKQKQKQRQKLRTQPISEKHQNKSCQQLENKRKSKRKVESVCAGRTQYLITKNA